MRLAQFRSLVVNSTLQVAVLLATPVDNCTRLRARTPN